MHKFFSQFTNKGSTKPSYIPAEIYKHYVVIDKQFLKTAYKQYKIPENAFKLGFYYHFHSTTKKMIPLYERAIAGGHIDAMFYLGYYYQFHNGFFLGEQAQRSTPKIFHFLNFRKPVNDPYQKMLDLYTQANEVSPNKYHPNATYYLGLYYHHLNDFVMAIKYYTIGMENGHAKCTYTLGYLLHEQVFKGKANQQIREKIVNYYISAFERGYIKALITLGFFFQFTQHDEEEMLFFYHSALNWGHDPTAYFSLGFYYSKQKDYELMVHYYKLAIEHIDKYEPISEYSTLPRPSINAMTNLGNYYMNIERNPVEMRKYHEMAIKYGSTNSMNALGWYFFNEDAHFKLAKLYFMMGSEQNSADSFYYLGVMAQLVDHDILAMKRWYQAAITEGHTHAMFYLGEFYLHEHQWDLAIELFRKVLTIGLDNNLVKQYLIMALKRKYNVLEAHADQTVHIHSIGETTNTSIGVIIKLAESLPKVHEPLNFEDDKIQADLKVWLKDPSVHSTHRITFQILLSHVVTIIENHPEKIDMRERLKQELLESIGECFTGHMNHVVNSLVGFIEGVTVTLSSTELTQMRIGIVVNMLATGKIINYTEAVGLLNIALVDSSVEIREIALKALEDFRPQLNKDNQINT